ncbi:nitrilase/cyanide hydratase and apolipoprotein N-acyltransferase [Nitratireductor indicus C115]|uniref:Nitrilase/cyanide hydratase and apolipoprotein N-acyltransferase n=1 Tax=Nitratireductor indicus C115 TaxID=1231190 RepID=K2NZF1_9HYPH|nr:carbon-nitrogen hydrolase family protein [Nitratireductor indicus]EKF40456.1 nitrilase/cyanide hydratase and apolipoprotein N-acyltransferase [Nitratireductor indicus C115]SFQ76802.1 Predicted amidohydrolase [Nitratireductor indicus]
MTGIRVAALQMRSGTEPEANAVAFEALVREAADKGAQYVQSPEMTGALVRSRAELLERIEGARGALITERAEALARELSIHVQVGSTAVALPDGRVANRAFLFSPEGNLIATYDKIHMFDVDLDHGESWRESATYAPGEAAVVADLPFGRMGFAICYDLRFPQLFRAEAVAGAQVLTAPAAFTRQTGEAHWHVLIRARAIENGAFMIAAAQGGKHEDGRETFGHSMIVDPWGRILAEAEGDAPEVVIADLDISEVAAARGKVPNLRNARDFTVKQVGAAEDAARSKAS